MTVIFPRLIFFPEFERFDRHVDKMRRKADAICEKPLVLNPWNLDGLEEVEADHGSKVYNILQLRLHPALLELKQKIDAAKIDEKRSGKKHEIDLIYITSRGN